MWGKDLTFHSDLLNKVIPLSLFEAQNWRYKGKDNMFRPRQYDVKFDIEVSVLLEEGKETQISVERQGGVSGVAHAYVKPMVNESSVVIKRRNSGRCIEGMDWDFLGGGSDEANFVTINNGTLKAKNIIELTAAGSYNDIEMEVLDEAISLEITEA